MVQLYKKKNNNNILIDLIHFLTLAIGNIEGDVKKSPKSSPEVRKRKPRKAD